jgi:hypothetical protein
LVDDGETNISAMQAALKDSGMTYYGLHYIRISKNLPAYSELSTGANKAWTEMSSFLSAVFPTRMKELKDGNCFY